jgi:hypothetical protein
LERGFRLTECCLPLISSNWTVLEVLGVVFLVLIILRLHLAILQGKGCLRMPIGTPRIIVLEPRELD